MTYSFTLGLGLGLIVASVLLTATVYVARQEAPAPQINICDGYVT